MSETPSISEQKYQILLNSYADLYEEVQKLRSMINAIGMMTFGVAVALAITIVV